MSDRASEQPVDYLEPALGPSGQRVHPQTLDQLGRLAPKLYTVGEHAWCVVGNGLSNQTFVRGPAGIIAIDTGECIEEMQAALAQLRTVTDEPIVGCIYTHFHYVNGTQAILEAESGQPHRTKELQIIGHSRIEHNLSRFGGEIAPRSNKGLVHQFGTSLPDEGSDALLHCGLGLHLRNPSHAPFTPGYIPANLQLDSPTTIALAGLEVNLTPAPADADDSMTIWFPELGLAVNNLVWPALFNIYAIRGEEYRDPRILLDGLDHLINLAPGHLIGTHGPPLPDLENMDDLLAYRDSIQFLWDQTVRRINAGDSINDAALNVQLPAHLRDSYLTQQFYGIAEHHVKQIHAGLFGWFDGDESQLLTLGTHDRNGRLIAGFGGRDEVFRQSEAALNEGDHRWALELASWLVRSDEAVESDRHQLARILRHIGQHTISANVRNWTLTRALELEGKVDLSRFDEHRFSQGQVLSAPPTRFIPTLRVLLDPEKAADLALTVGWKFSTGERCGLKLRNQVAIPTDGEECDIQLGLSHETWAQILSAKLNIWAAIDEGLVSVAGDAESLSPFFAAFDLASIQPPAS